MFPRFRVSPSYTLPRWRIGLLLMVTTMLFIFLAGPEWPAYGDPDYKLRALVGPRQFDFVTWETDALYLKGESLVTRAHAYLDNEARRAIVDEFMGLIGEIRQLERELDVLVGDSSITDRATQVAGIEAEIALKRAHLAEIQPVAEAILEEQVTAVLAKQGFALFGTVLPPVKMHLTPLPSILILSPRDRIEREDSVPLVAGLGAGEHDVLENQAFEQLNLSALVVPIGGLGIFPAMILETSNLNWVVSTIAHEWVHHYLSFLPLGANYGVSSDTRTMNETVASLVGDEIGRIVIETYYPERIPQPAPPQEVPVEEALPLPFDFREEMRITRVETDRLLANGEIEEAEAYMESRRLLFWDNGFSIRKLNQAYFSFYGAYADAGGATGADPVGPAVQTVWDRSGSIKEFLNLMAPVTTYQELHGLVTELEPAN